MAAMYQSAGRVSTGRAGICYTAPMKDILEKILLRLVGIENQMKHMVTQEKFDEKIDDLYEYIDGLAGNQKVI